MAEDEAFVGKELQPAAFKSLPFGTIKPKGWLYQQLRIQADGLSGHLDEFWLDVKESAWLGGKAEGWERAPYWLDGVVPLAFLLDDEKLKDKVKRYIEYIMEHQQKDGWLGYLPENPRQHDIWSLFLVLKPLIQYYEATGDERVVGVVEKCLYKINLHIDHAPLFNWAYFRWFEGLIGIYWLHEKTHEPWLVDLANKLHTQGFDWGGFYERFPIKEPTPKGGWNFISHVVNNAMAVKAPALWYRISGNQHDREMSHRMIEELDKYHGMVTGIFTGDECLAGRNPSQGTELCAVVEYMYSLEVLLGILGDPKLGDRLEKIAFNALPATFSPDMWAHQYDQQVNQVECSVRENRNWTTNGPDANIFGVEPNYGCCTANLSQGFPKFTCHLWMESVEGGLAAIAYAPCLIQTEVKGVPVKIAVETEYPFRDSISIRVTVEKAVNFPMLLRIPSWAVDPRVQVNGEKKVKVEPGKFHEICQEWRDSVELNLVLPMKPVATRRFNNAVSIERGPLVYSLKIEEDWRRIHEDTPGRELPHGDWEVIPASPWNYAIEIDETSKDIIITEQPVGDCPFSPDGAPVVAKLKGRRLPEWQMENGSAQPPPMSPVKTSEPLEELTLIPYGCTHLRITEFPVIGK